MVMADERAYPGDAEIIKVINAVRPWQPGDKVRLNLSWVSSDKVGVVVRYEPASRIPAGYVVDWGAGPVEEIIWQAHQLRSEQ